ncbi:hypothetical protein BG015_010954 [Linnemannia schmuckeri]|uniref:Uncharacterized protein n=1 Tax=Linnemannia schmuckeri TaxID=64567 RepID=A0A9P5RTS3_9FUNG|nr:hypothetical protein BG015_010954 [Linnemannia schmuckeri]
MIGHIWFLSHWAGLTKLQELRGSFSITTIEVAARMGEREVDWLATHLPALRRTSLLPVLYNEPFSNDTSKIIEDIKKRRNKGDFGCFHDVNYQGVIRRSNDNLADEPNGFLVAVLATLIQGLANFLGQCRCEMATSILSKATSSKTSLSLSNRDQTVATKMTLDRYSSEHVDRLDKILKRLNTDFGWHQDFVKVVGGVAVHQDVDSQVTSFL